MHIINDSISEVPSHIKNSCDLIDKLRNICFDPDYILISFDVISIFINVPVDLVFDSVKRVEIYLVKNENVFRRIFKIQLNSTFLMFNNKFYKQIFGIPMGSPLSPILADIVMQDFEKKVISMLSARLLFYFRYVDDIIF